MEDRVGLLGDAISQVGSSQAQRELRKRKRSLVDEEEHGPSKTAASSTVGQTQHHQCVHCSRVQISTDPKLQARFPPSRRSWPYILPHTMDEVAVAASGSCPFFACIWGQVLISNTPEIQLRNTQIELDIRTGESVGNLIAENSYAVGVMMSAKHYSWKAVAFTLASSFGTKYPVPFFAQDYNLAI